MFQKLELTRDDMGIGFDTFLYTYHYDSVDPFVFIAKNFDLEANLKYMVAIRSHVISPQYIFKILQSFYYLNKTDKDPIRLNRYDFEQAVVENKKPVPVYINLITGGIDDERQQNYGGTIQEINDNSTFEERSNHLIKFVNEFNMVNEKHFDNFFHLNLYVTTTNEHVFNEVIKKNNKIIIEYLDYKNKKFNITDASNIMITFNPIIRKTQEELDAIKLDNTLERVLPNSVLCTPKQLKEILQNFEKEGIEEVLFWSSDSEDRKNICDFVKEYVDGV